MRVTYEKVLNLIVRNAFNTDITIKLGVLACVLSSWCFPSPQSSPPWVRGSLVGGQRRLFFRTANNGIFLECENVMRQYI